MAISLREIVTGVNSGAAASVNIGAGTLSTDLLVAVGWSDFYTLGTFGPPSGGGWTERTTADLGANNSKCRVWTKTAAAGAATITLSPIIDEDVALAVLVLAGADTTTPTDGAAGGTSPGDNPAPSLHVAPSVSPSTSDAYLICAAGTSVFNGGAAYTTPASMTERAEFNTPGNTTTQVVATQQLAASGATGTRTFEYGGADDPGVAVSVAVRTAATATTLTVADSTHAQTADNLTLTQQHQLTVADATHGQSVDNLTLTQVHQLAVADATHQHTADQLTLTQVHELVVADATHQQRADQVTLTSGGVEPAPPEQTYIVPAETRVYAVPAENRIYQLPAEDRTYELPAEDRTYEVSA